MKYLMQQTMRWFGPNDVVSLADIRQSGCSGVVTALHQIPVGEVWTIDAINERKSMIESYGMDWTVVESLPVSDEIKKRRGNFQTHIDNYKQSIINLAECGIEVITYNFMPVLDWLRTDVNFVMPDGSKALYFHHLDFVVFDVFLLKRPLAEADYVADILAAAKERYDQMPASEKERILKNAMLGLPGSSDAFTPEQVLKALESYSGIDTQKLKEHLFTFIKEIIPVADANNIKLAIHPDDPPFPVLGLPRILSTKQDVEDLFNAVPSVNNGLCFCTGSFGARADNDLPEMLNLFCDRIHFLHLRNTKRDEAGNFYEARHLEGDADMFSIIKAIYKLQQKRGISLPMRPDHGHQMLDDLQKNAYPGYSAIGRLKALAELRGLEYAISKMND
ncbi:mannonate dehydratase [Polluticaenibacter yanchengensis]|uniref:Mannonate dehydratase n=1 Tax=Polluticaenibacter yanchengensis TaxID=3014562 RepID=A0ABT4UMM7_9BACT|nr:mannonate dehydratase [Chitinophagaceae bacterium LY-5]